MKLPFRSTADPTTIGSAKSTSRRAVVTLMDQGLSSVSNFAVGVVVARLAGPVGLGVFSLAYASWLLLASMHRSLITDPMAIEGDARNPAYGDGIKRGLAAELILGTAAAILFGLVGALLFCFGQHQFGLAMLAVAPWLPTLVIQDYWRWIGFMTAHPGKSLANDIVFDIMEMIAFLLVFLADARGSIVLLASWGVGGLAGAVYGLWQNHLLSPMARWRSEQPRTSHHVGQFFISGLQLIRERWELGRWIAGNQLLSWGATQGYIFVAGFILGPTGLGGLKAAQTIVTGPAGVLIQAGGSVGLPEASRAYADRGWSGLLRVARVVTALGVASVGGCTLIMVVAGRFLLTKVYGPQFAHLQEAAVLIGAGQTLSAFGLGSILILKATRNTRALIYTVSVGAVVSVGGVALLSTLYGVNGAAMASVAVSAVGLTGVRWFQHRVHRAAMKDGEVPPDQPVEGELGMLTPATTGDEAAYVTVGTKPVVQPVEADVAP